MSDEPAHGDAVSSFRPLPTELALAPDGKTIPDDVRELLARRLLRGAR